MSKAITKGKQKRAARQGKREGPYKKWWDIEPPKSPEMVDPLTYLRTVPPLKVPNFMLLDGEEVEDDCTALKFPPEFEKAQTMLISEVRIVLEEREKAWRDSETVEDLSNTFIQTKAMVDRFSKFKNTDVIQSLRNKLAKYKFHQFELASLANLCPQSPYEAQQLIPSLKSRKETELQSCINDMVELREFTM